MAKKNIREVDIANLLSGISYTVYKSILSIEEIPNNILTTEDKIFIVERLKETCDEVIGRLSVSEPVESSGIDLDKILASLEKLLPVEPAVTSKLELVKEKDDKEAEVIAEVLLKLVTKFHAATARSLIKQLKNYKGSNSSIKNIKLLISEFPEQKGIEFIKKVCSNK